MAWGVSSIKWTVHKSIGTHQARRREVTFWCKPMVLENISASAMEIPSSPSIKIMHLWKSRRGVRADGAVENAAGTWFVKNYADAELYSLRPVEARVPCLLSDHRLHWSGGWKEYEYVVEVGGTSTYDVAADVLKYCFEVLWWGCVNQDQHVGYFRCWNYYCRTQMWQYHKNSRSCRETRNRGGWLKT